MGAIQNIKEGDIYSNLFILSSVTSIGFYISKIVVGNIKDGNLLFKNLLYPISFITLCLFTYYILFINDEYYQII